VSDQGKHTVERLYELRHAQGWRDRVARALRPPAPFIPNPHEQIEAPLGRWNLYIGGGGCLVDGYVNLDLFPVAGVDVAADAALLPFGDEVFQRVECDAVLEPVPDPERVMREIARVLKPGGYAHVVTPFCHPFHEYPRDYRRFTPDGLSAMAGPLEPVASGWRTGPTATMLVFTLEYAKLLLPWKWWRVAAHGVLGWILFPLRYLDVWLLRSKEARRIGNHCFLWLRKPNPQAGSGTI
jgi:SAM-dependent methyltransferase